MSSSGSKITVEVTPETTLLDVLPPEDLTVIERTNTHASGWCTFQDGTSLSYSEKLSAVFLYAQIWLGNTYLRNGVTLHDGAQIVDVGANIGMFSLAASKRWTGLKVLAIEAVPTTAQELRRNLTHHGIEFVIEQCAIGARSGTVELLSRPWAPNIAGRADVVGAVSSMHEFRAEMFRSMKRVAATRAFDTMVDGYTFHGSDVERIVEISLRELGENLENRELTDRPDEKIICQSRTVDEILDAHAVDTVDLLKVDVEGVAAEVIMSISPQRWKTIRQVAMECDREVEAVAERIHSHGFEVVLGPRFGGDEVGDFASVHLYARRPTGSDTPQILDHGKKVKMSGPGYLDPMAGLVLQTLVHVNADAVKRRYASAIARTVQGALNIGTPGSIAVVMRK
ncbi:MAG: FkbM family methyltransferase [Deltaproteobacteria bacterium]|nr:FkbM family methyltransferase [Deltaproteobacteria bacterium]